MGTKAIHPTTGIIGFNRNVRGRNPERHQGIELRPG
jgi:hypothetical protein